MQLELPRISALVSVTISAQPVSAEYCLGVRSRGKVNMAICERAWVAAQLLLCCCTVDDVTPLW